MGDWDDDDFEVDVKQLDEKKHTVVEEVAEEKPGEEQQTTHATSAAAVHSSKPKKKVAAKNSALNTFTTDLNRELTEKEREQLQRRGDLMLAKDLFGIETDEPQTYAELETLDEFRTFGEKMGKMLSSRTNATHYVDMLTSLLKIAVSNLDAHKTRQLSALMKTLADEKTAIEKKAKVKGAAAKPSIKSAPKAGLPSTKANKDLYEDYVTDEYDDYVDDFM